jgi:membrane protein DedA with SNARE-associated domain
MMEAVVNWATSLVETLGYAGVALLVALENLFPPIPSEVVLPLAGFVAASEEASIGGMVLAATIGSMLGAYALYGVSAAVGPIRLRRFVEKYGRWLRLGGDDLDRAEAWFDQKARTVVMISRCVPLMRSLISVPAGFRRMPLLQFSMYTLAGSLVWNLALVGAGYLLGENWKQAGQPVEVLQGVVLIAIVGAVAWFVWRRTVSPRLNRQR